MPNMQKASRGSAANARFVFGHPVHLLAFGFGSGLTPVAPGTAGTLMAMPLYFVMQGLPLAAYLMLTGGMLVAGFWICAYTSRALSVHDHEGIVWDEMVGYLLTMCMAPEGWHWIVLGFVLFRVFDVLKPWPAGWLDQNVRGGVGIMSDDVVGAVYGFLVLQLTALCLA